jgi:2-phospho-L-lactate guanylyltransferase
VKRVALVPVKALGVAKSRLAGTLDREAHDALILAMLEDVVAALGDTPEVDEIVVVTPDPAVAAVARAAGARALVRDDPGLNAALDAAGARLAQEGADALLVVLGDVAGALPRDLSALFAALPRGGGAALAPSRDGGTAALLRQPPACVPNRFGPESARAHREAAAAHGVALSVCALPSLAIDLDRPEDLEALRARPEGAARTRALLAARAPRGGRARTGARPAGDAP